MSWEIERTWGTREDGSRSGSTLGYKAGNRERKRDPGGKTYSDNRGT